MKKVNINKQIGCKTFLFPDKQPHINIDGVNENDEVQVTCSITDANNLLLLLQCSNALDNLFAKKKELVIPYLMGARFDRLMQKGDSIDLKVIANLINGCGFEKVYLYDVHSDTSTVLIENSINISNAELVKQYTKEDAILICPDAGAVKKVSKYFDLNSNIKDVVYCNKSRDLSNGNITLKVLEADKCEGKNCVIIDDLCDGGGTFLAIASQIKPAHITLIVTHGIFSKGFDVFKGTFDEIIVSDSYAEYTNELVNQIKFEL
jgi:ribose-phosphate pyrophosphokinase